MKYTILTIFALLPLIAGAQATKSISFDDYMDQVRELNIAYAAQKLNIPIASANITSAKVFNDPSLSVEYAYNDDRRMQMGQGISGELGKTFSLGKRTARVDLARSEKEVTEALLEDFFRNLHAHATIAYFEAIKQRALYDLKLNSYNSISELAAADSVKFVFGKITQVDAFQSRIEASVSYNELLQSRADLYNSYAALNIPLGRSADGELYEPSDERLELPRQVFVCADLVALAVDNRADLVAALKNVDVAQKALKLVRRERNIDLDVALGYNYNTEVRNELAPTPRFNGVAIGLSIPLKFSNLNKGALRAAALQSEQAERYYQQARLEVQTEVVQNYNTYVSLTTQVDSFNAGMLSQAALVLDGKRYSYNRGESSLLELLNAQRTYNDVRSLYIETLFNHACSLIRLEQSTGCGRSGDPGASAHPGIV